MHEIILALDKVSISYNNVKILDEVSISIKEKEITTLIGPNGGGKTTCVKLLLGLIEPHSGKAIRSPKISSIGYMPQKVVFNKFMPITVRYFLSLSSGKNLPDLFNEFNINNILNNQIHQISGGELQRVMLVRALLNRPNLLVLDEPTQGLDVQGQADFYALLEKIKANRNITILIISHDLYTVMRSTDHVICLNRHICCEGTSAAISKEPSFINLFGENEIRNMGIYSHHHNHTH